MFSIDGVTWEYPCEIKRTSEVESSEISGMLMDRTYFNDVLGTWLKYDVSIAVPRKKLADYAAVYERLTAPEEGHSFVLPYNSGTISVTGRVDSVKDTLYKANGGNYWAGISFTVIANHPSKYMELGEVIEAGREPVPAVISPVIGDLYEFTENGWEQVDIENADLKQY